MAGCMKALKNLMQLTVRNQIYSCTCRTNRLLSSATQSLTTFTGRTHLCGELRADDAGKEVVLCGWLQYRRMDLFLLLRDWQGLTQIILPEEKKVSLMEELSRVPFESVLEIQGTVRLRPAGQENEDMPTGSVEVVVNNLKVLNKCQPQLPFEIKPHHKVKEALRMQYRYLDIRRPLLQQNLRLRSTMVMRMREFLCNQHGFVDVETPTLFRRTPGGAKEFVVPSHHPGKFYSLPQSPQQFKQLLMVGGLDRYFQVARCYRDEGSKPDRQPEFTQMDIEMSFTSQDGVISLIEDLLHYSWPKNKGQLVTPFPRMTYDTAMARYGIDKPDTRFDMMIEDMSKHLQDTSVLIFQSAESIHALTVPDGTKYLSKKDIEGLIGACKEEAKNVTLLSIKVREGGSWNGGVAKYLSADDMSRVTSAVNANPGDVIFITAGTRYDALSTLGKARLRTANILESKGVHLRDKEKFNFLWVVDFPLFLPKEDGEGLESAHHPFTAPHPQDADLLSSDPLRVRSQHYDLVLNGNEVGGGSIRIHNSQMQRFILESVLQEDSTELQHLLEALNSGCPPHGGIALGLDRLMALICGADSIRDVIAFPKSHDGKDPMSQAPAPVSQKDLDPYFITISPGSLGNSDEGERGSG